MLLDGYRDLVRRLYTPKNYYRRIITFLREYRPSGPRIPITTSDVRAFVRSLWVMGVLESGRLAYWKFVTRALVFHRRAFAEAMSLAITGHHFRQIADSI